MSETAKWRIEGEGAWEMTRFWLSDSTGRRIEDVDMPAFVESLEASLAEAQAKYDIRGEILVAAIERAEVAEQLAEVKAENERLRDCLLDIEQHIYQADLTGGDIMRKVIKALYPNGRPNVPSS